MKLLLLVIGCCVALAVSKPAEDACAAMRARLLPSLEPSARADAGALRACDADSDGAVDAAELVSCVQRAFGSTARLDPAEIEERIHCLRNIVRATALDGQKRQTIYNKEQSRQLSSGFSALSGGLRSRAGLPNRSCADSNQLGDILDGIAEGQLQAAYNELINWYVGIISLSSNLLNGLLNNVSYILQILLSGISHESLVYLVTQFVRSASNALTQPVEDALISALFQISIGNFTAARIVIEARLDDGVLNPVTQIELQWIIDAFDAEPVDDAVTRIISLLAGCEPSAEPGAEPSAEPSAEPDGPIFLQLLELYDLAIERGDISQVDREFEDVKNFFHAIYNQTLERQPPVNSGFIELFENILFKRGVHSYIDVIYYAAWLMVFPCGYDRTFAVLTSLSVIDIRTEGKTSYFDVIFSLFGGNPSIYSRALNHVDLARHAYNNSDFDAAYAELRNIYVTCVVSADV